MSSLDMTDWFGSRRAARARIALFVLLQVGVMLMAISGESLWIDEFWSAYFASVESIRKLFELILIPNGSQTPLHFIHLYAWQLFTPIDELSLRLANLPLFLLGQLSLLWGLRTYARKFAYLLLVISALHPMVWQYANEARQYIMMYAGAEMILAYLLDMHAQKDRFDQVGVLSTAIFVVGAILLFGSSLLGVFWVFAATLYIANFHYLHLSFDYMTRGLTALLGIILITAVSLLVTYYGISLLRGAGASRVSASSLTTVIFAIYELLGLSGIGPSRLELRSSGSASLNQYWVILIAGGGAALATASVGLREATRVLGRNQTIVVFTLALFPVVVVLLSGFAMHWRVLGRHLIASLPVLNLLLALGMGSLFDANIDRGRVFRSAIAVGLLVLFIYSSLSLRFAPRHRKDDYRAAAAIARQEYSQGKRVWWAADALGAKYYGLPGEFDVMAELTGSHTSDECVELAGVRSIANASKACLDRLAAPDLIIISKPETFDMSGDIAAYLNEGKYSKVETPPAFDVWRRAGSRNLVHK